MINQNIKKSAFTLIELIVSVAIITIVILATLGIYVYVIGSREKTLSQINLQQDGQYIMNLVAKDIRANKIDYSAYTSCDEHINGCSCDTKWCGISGASGNNTTCPHECSLGSKCIDSPEHELQLIDENNNTTTYQLDSKKVQKCYFDGSTTTCQYISMTKDLSVTKLDFYICPRTNPFIPGSKIYKNPRVTIILTLESNTEKNGKKTLTIQQTVAQRYELKQ